MASVRELETKLDVIVNKQAPQLPAGAKTALFNWSPWIALVVGIFSLLGAYGLWSAARGVHNSAYVIQQLCSTYAGGSNNCDIPSTVSHLNFWVWLGIISLVIQGVFYLRAYPRLREHTKAGWNFLFYAALTNVIYAIITLLTSYDMVGHFIGAAISAVVTFYLLFQIRPLFVGAREVVPTAAPTPSIAEPKVDEPETKAETETETEAATEPEPVIRAATTPAVAPKLKIKAKSKATPKEPAAKKKPAAKKRTTKKKA